MRRLLFVFTLALALTFQANAWTYYLEEEDAAENFELFEKSSFDAIYRSCEDNLIVYHMYYEGKLSGIAFATIEAIGAIPATSLESDRDVLSFSPWERKNGTFVFHKENISIAWNQDIDTVPIWKLILYTVILSEDLTSYYSETKTALAKADYNIETYMLQVYDLY